MSGEFEQLSFREQIELLNSLEPPRLRGEVIELRQSTERLTRLLVWLTVALVVLTTALLVLALRH
jgi:hypothetical protein